LLSISTGIVVEESFVGAKVDGGIEDVVVEVFDRCEHSVGLSLFK